jgi:preprotein translocase SecE subunit
VARQTRAERRARRQQQGEPALAGAGGGGSGGGDKPPVSLAPEPPSRPERGKPAPGKPAPAETGAFKFFTGTWRFLGESWGELRKTEWPGQSHVIQGTVVVLMACIIMGTFIWVCDIAWKHLVQDLLIK